MQEIAEELGMFFENKIREKILSNVPPENTPGTIAAKGSSHTLIDTGTLLASITHQVEESQSGLTIASGVLDEDIAERAAPNEYGVIWENRPIKGKEENKNHGPWFIPPRSFVRSTYDENIDEAMTLASDLVHKFVFNKLKK